MPKKRRFRKLYFICTDNIVIGPQFEFTPAFPRKAYADNLCVQQENHFIWEDKSKPVPVKTVEGFYLVHESLYNEILKDHDADAGE